MICNEETIENARTLIKLYCICSTDRVPFFYASYKIMNVCARCRMLKITLLPKYKLRQPIKCTIDTTSSLFSSRKERHARHVSRLIQSEEKKTSVKEKIDAHFVSFLCLSSNDCIRPRSTLLSLTSSRCARVSASRRSLLIVS